VVKNHAAWSWVGKILTGHPRAYRSRMTDILQTALVSSIIFYVTRVAVMAPLPGKECYEDKRRDR
jgi:hypothetical protein